MKLFSRSLLSLCLLTLLAGALELKIFPANIQKDRRYVIDLSGSFRPYLEPHLMAIISAITSDKADPKVVGFAAGSAIFKAKDLNLFNNYQRLLAVNPDGSDIKSALSLLDFDEDSSDRHVVLISDGNLDAEITELASYFNQRKIRVDALAFPDPQLNDLKVIDYTVEKLTDGFRLIVQLYSTMNAEILLKLKGLEDAGVRHQIAKGVNVIARKIERAGVYTVKLEPSFDDCYPVNNEFTADVQSSGESSLLLLSNNHAIKNLISGIFQKSVVYDKLNLQIPFDLILMDDYSLENIDQNHLVKIKELVYSGSALIVLGGPNAYGADYELLDFDDILPCDLASKSNQDLVFIIDNSGSMDAKFRGRRKYDYMDEAVDFIKRSFSGNSKVSVMSFRDKPTFSIKDQPLTRLKRSDFEFEAGGATNISDAIMLLKNIYNPDQLSLRKVILFTDLQTKEDHEHIKTLLKTLPCNVTIILAGNETELSRKLLNIDNIEIQNARDLGSIKKISEDKGEKIEVYDERLASVSGIKINKINALSLKDGATLHARKGALPLVASWSHGSGFIACSTLSFAGSWGEINEDFVRALFSLAQFRKKNIELSYQYLQGGRTKIQMWLEDTLPVEVTSLKGYCPQTKSYVELRRNGFNSFDAILPFAVDQSMDLICGQYTGWLSIPYHREYSETSINYKYLQELSSATGGRLISEVELVGALNESRFGFVSSVSTSLILAFLFFAFSVMVEMLNLARN